MSNTNIDNLHVTRPDGEFTITQPNDGVLVYSLNGLELESDSFLIYEQDENRYLQIMRTAGDAYYIEYRENENGPNYFVAEQPFREASSILLDFVHNRDFKRNLLWGSVEGTGTWLEENDFFNEVTLETELASRPTPDDAVTQRKS